MVERVNIGKHDIAVFATWFKEGSGLFVAVELEVFWRLREAKNIDRVIFEGLIVEQMDVWRIIKCLHVSRIIFGIPMAVTREHVVILRISTIKIMIAKRNEDWRDFAKLLEPGSEAFEVGSATNIVESRLNRPQSGYSWVVAFAPGE